MTVPVLVPCQVCKITFPVPPSLNNAYATVRGRRVLSKQGREFKAAVRLWVLVEQQCRYTSDVEKWAHIEGQRLALSIALHFKNNQRRDISNCVKLVEDALAEELGFDDSAVHVLHVERKENDKQNPHCEVKLEVL